VSSTYLDSLAAMIRDEVPSDALPKQVDTLPLFRTYAVLLEALGVNVTPRDVHNAWVAWMTEVDGRHYALVPYEELPPEVAEQDRPYVGAIQRVAARLAATSQRR
jgi:hypothetical protein